MNYLKLCQDALTNTVFLPLSPYLGLLSAYNKIMSLWLGHLNKFLLMLFSVLGNTHTACETAEGSVPLSAPHLITYTRVLSPVQSLSRVRLFATPCTAACEASPVLALNISHPLLDFFSATDLIFQEIISTSFCLF